MARKIARRRIVEPLAEANLLNKQKKTTAQGSLGVSPDTQGISQGE